MSSRPRQPLASRPRRRLRERPSRDDHQRRHALDRPHPAKLAAAGVVTINEFVAGLFTANGGLGSVMADGNPVFDAANHQGNTGVAALSSPNLQTALTVMLKFTNSAAKRIGVAGKYLLLPPDLYFTGQVILGSDQLPGGNNNDVNPVKGALTPINVPNRTDSNNWYVMADPAQIEGIELGFLNGREEPELLIQDGPTVGTVLTNDAIRARRRHRPHRPPRSVQRLEAHRRRHEDHLSPPTSAASTNASPWPAPPR